jgi:predicted nucleic acid-binding protein
VTPDSAQSEAVVVDASAIVTLLIDPDAAGERIASRLASAQLHAPDHLAVEVTNVLRRRRNADQLTNTEARLAFDAFRSIPVQLWPFEALAERAWGLGHNLSSYDAAYVALAEQIGAPLVTGDARLSRASGPTCSIELIES